MNSFLETLGDLISQMKDTQQNAVEQAASLGAEAIRNDGWVHFFGSGHSVIPVHEAFPRYGVFVGLHPLTDPRLMWFNVLGPGGVRELLWLEREEGYVEKYLDHQPLAPGDVLVVFSHSGRNSAPVEAAMYARERGLSVVAVTAKANLSRPAGHSSGKFTADLADVVIDTGAPVEDAVVHLEGWGAPLGGVSTILACAVTVELVTRIAANLLESGITMPTFVSPTVPGASVEANDAVFEVFQERLFRSNLRPRN
ncbi:MAG: SIS domain-containing protein [bacterium]|nr:SIS domain-containing protein [bacterium]MDE0602732.1 SIS domain-containing protein [bacterium]